MAEEVGEFVTSIQTVANNIYVGDIQLNIEDFLNWIEFQREDAKVSSKHIKIKCGNDILTFELYLQLGKKDDDDVSIFLVGKDLIEANLHFTFLHITASQSITKGTGHGRLVKGNPGWGIKKFISKQQLKEEPTEYLPGGALKIQCVFKVFRYKHLTTFNKDSVTTIKSVSVSNRFSSLWKKELLVDFKLICGNENFPCHKLALATISDVFEAMFRHTDLAEGRRDEAIIKDCSPEILEKFLEFIYTEDLEDKEGFNSKALLILSDRYNVVSLKMRCERTIAKGLNCSNAIGLINLATTIPTPILLEQSARFVAKNHQKLKDDKEWTILIENNPQAMSAIIKYGLP